jgi:hypothetical protein
MEPIAHDYQRQDALNLAIMFVQARPRYSPKETTEIAELFLDWLTNVEGSIDG